MNENVNKAEDMNMTQQQYIEEAEKALLHTYNRYQVVLDRGEGVYLYDLDGKKYLDFASYFIDERGKQPFYFVTERLGQQQDAFRFSGNDAHGLRYFQSHKPVREQDEEGAAEMLRRHLKSLREFAVTNNDENHFLE